MTKLDVLTKLLTRKSGVTSMEIVERCGTVAPHKRLSELKDRGWTITKQKVDGCNFHRYFGLPPMGGA